MRLLPLVGCQDKSRLPTLAFVDIDHPCNFLHCPQAWQGGTVKLITFDYAFLDLFVVLKITTFLQGMPARGASPLLVYTSIADMCLTRWRPLTDLNDCRMKF